jgi:cobalt-zinc-cadmium efflux system outer membrane protein
LIAAESLRQNRALVQLTDEVYKVMVQQLRGGELATYEPMQVGVFAAQARANLIQARNSYTLAWKQLAVAMGLPGMPPTELAGSIRQLPLPQYRFDTILAHVLSSHTDVNIALNAIGKARYNLRLAEVTAVPDITVGAAFLNDITPPGPPEMVFQGNLSVALPVWNLNQGNVYQARAALVRANEEPHRVRADLTGRMADAYRRYSENFDLLELYHKEILPKQVQAYRSAVQRHYGGEAGGVAYNDLVSAEQNLVGVIGSYLTVLQAQWQAVADVGSLLQTDDIFQFAEGRRFADVPDLSQLLELCCCHPCSPPTVPSARQADLDWPKAGFASKTGGTLGTPVPHD